MQRAGAAPVEVVGKRTRTEMLDYQGGIIQRRAIGSRAGQIAAEHVGQAAAATAASSGSGAPIEPAVRAKMESSLGADFSAVRVHEGAAAPSIGAAAFTHGHDIHFAPGRYQPHIAEGQRLLGHELTHVVQQAEGRASGSQGKGAALNADPALEAEADAMGDRAAAGEPARTGSVVGASATATAVQRQPFDFNGVHIDPSNEDAFHALVANAGRGSASFMSLPALHKALIANNEPEGAQYVADYMSQVLSQPMHAPDELQMEPNFRGVLDELWNRTAQSGHENGGLLREHRDTRDLTFETAQGADNSHFAFNFTNVQADENIPAIAHTHPSGSSFSGVDLADQHRSRASVEYIRTATSIFAIVKSGDYWNRITQLLAQFDNDPAVLSQRIRANFNLNFEEAKNEFLARYQREPDETIEQVVDLCTRFATKHAVKCYARTVHAGYYEGASNADRLNRVV